MKDRKLLILDCFGLFARDPFVTYFKRHFGPESMPIKDKYCEPADLGKISFEQLVEGMVSELGVNRNEMLAELKEIGKPIQEMIDWTLKMKEKHRVILLSNCMDKMMDVCFAGTRFFDCFDEVYLSYKIGMVKPYEDIYKKLLKEQEGQYDLAVFIDDNPRNLVMAERLGIKTILFTSFLDMKERLEKMGY